MAIILNIETSTEACSIALGENGRLISEQESIEGLNHSELLTVFIEELFRKNNIGKKDIDAVAVSKGPGSYTGLRIGVSVAKGICYALEKPLIAVSTLDAMANYTAQNIELFDPDLDDDYLLCPMIDARRMEVYTSVYDVNGNSREPISAKIVDDNSFYAHLEKSQMLFFGNGAEKCSPKLNHRNAVFAGPVKASARFMIVLSEQKYNNAEFENVAYFEPFYLKDFVATIPKNKII